MRTDDLGYEAAYIPMYPPPPSDGYEDSELEYLWKHQNPEAFRRDLDEALGNSDTTKLAAALRHGTAQEVRREIEAIFTRYWDARIRRPGYER